MKKYERIFCMLAVVVTITIALLGPFGVTPWAQASPFVGDGNWMNGNFGLQDANWSSSSSMDGNSVNGGFSINFDAQKFSIDDMNWSFYTNSWDTSWWNAVCYLHGKRNSSEPWPQNQSWSQSVMAEGVNINAYLSFYSSYESWQNKPEVYLWGNISVSPSDYANSNFTWYETQDTNYFYPNGWDNDPVITYSPAWRGEYRLSGQFIAATLAEAQAMGAQFAPSVPEPATITMSAIFCLALGGYYLRRHKR